MGIMDIIDLLGIMELIGILDIIELFAIMGLIELFTIMGITALIQKNREKSVFSLPRHPHFEICNCDLPSAAPSLRDISL
jgi:hypothetical protein